MKKVYFITLIVVSLFLISGSAIAIYWPQIFHPAKPKPPVKAMTTTTEDTMLPEMQEPDYTCPLDGEPATEEQSLRRPLAVMIENSREARPQSGLTKACTVYETVAEGGITRFMAIFLHNDVDTIGPVRSAREYYANLAKQYNALYAHCGGPDTVYPIIRGLNLSDLDEFANSNAYWRDHSRKAPHNLYTSTAKLRKAADKRKYKGAVFFEKPNFKDDEPFEVRPESASIDIKFSEPAFSVHYEYDRQSNEYKRFMAGTPHIDNDNGQQISPKNIIIQFVSISRIAADPKGRMKVGLTGTGKAVVFQDGKAIDATWQRQTVSDLTAFVDDNGNEIELNRGQTWVELVDPVNMKVIYKAANSIEPTQSIN